MTKRSEDSYIIHNIITAFAHYGYPQAGDSENLKVKGDVPIRIGSKYYSPDLVYYASGVPLILVEDKRPKQSEEGAKEQAFSYLKSFPVEKYSRDNIRPKYLATTIGQVIKAYKYRYEIDEQGELIEGLIPLLEIPSYEELKIQYGIIEDEKPRLTLRSFKDLFYELASALDISEENKITPQLILKAVRLIFEYLEDSKNYTSRFPYTELDGKPDRQQWIRNILSQYNWQKSLGEKLAFQFRTEILRSFQGANLNQYVTPKSVIDFMVNLCQVKPEDKILDFECGSGGFIATVVSQGVSMKNILGIDIADLPYYVAKTYLALYFKATGKEIEKIPIKMNNGLYFWGDDWDVVIGNPAGGNKYDPKGKLGDCEKVLENLERDLDQNGRNDSFSEYNFSIQQAVRSCKVGGKICLILPESFFANSTNEFLREYMVKYCQIKAIVSLPRGVFRKGTTTKTVQSGSTGSSQKMSILFAEKIEKVKNGSGLEIGLDALDYPVFLASVQKPKNTGSDSNDWLEPLLAEVLKNWQEWNKNSKLIVGEGVLEFPKTASSKNWLGVQRTYQQQLIKPGAPLLDMLERKPRTPKTKKTTLIPKILKDLFN